jgi:hypothetical protein
MIMKKKTAIFLALLMMLPLLTGFTSVPPTALEFVLPCGEAIEYFLDREGKPYRYERGERIFMLLPTEHNRVTDPEVLAMLNARAFGSVDHNELSQGVGYSSTSSAPPTVYYDLDSGGPAHVNSHVYSAWMPLMGFTDILKLNRQHSAIALRTTNMSKGGPLGGIFTGNRVDLQYFLYWDLTNSWHVEWKYNINATITNGYRLGLLPSMNSFVMIVIHPNDDILSLTANVWTTWY